MRFWVGKILLIAFAMLGAQAARAECDRSYTIRVSGSFPRSFSTAVDGSRAGLEVEFIRRVMVSAGCAYRLVELPWQRALLHIEHGKVDVMTVASYTRAREGFGRFSRAYRRETVGMLVRRDDLARPVRQLEDLAVQDMQAYYLRGSYLGPGFAAFRDSRKGQMHLGTATTLQQAIQGLLLDRVDAILSDAIVMSRHIRRAGLTHRLGMHDFVVWENDVYFLLSRQTVSARDVDRLDRAIAEVVSQPDNPFAHWRPKKTVRPGGGS